MLFSGLPSVVCFTTTLLFYCSAILLPCCLRNNIVAVAVVAVVTVVLLLFVAVGALVVGLDCRANPQTIDPEGLLLLFVFIAV